MSAFPSPLGSESTRSLIRSKILFNFQGAGSAVSNSLLPCGSLTVFNSLPPYPGSHRFQTAQSLYHFRNSLSRGFSKNPQFSTSSVPRGSLPFRVEAPPRFELGIRVLQTLALPLGYSADMKRSIKNQGRLERITRLELATSTLARWRSTR